MPTSLVGLLVFVVLLAPGFAFVVRRETRFVPRTASVFRETAVVILASVAANTVTLILFSIIRTLAPDSTPDVGVLITDPSGYFAEHYRSVGVWGAALLLSSITIAGLAAVPPRWLVTRWLSAPRWLQPRWLEEIGNPIVYRSAWDRLMNLVPEDQEGPVDVWVSCELQDGTYLSGPLFSLNPDVDEDADRELILKAPVLRRSPEADNPTRLDVGAVSVSARYVKYVGWSYVTPSETDTL